MDTGRTSGHAGFRILVVDDEEDVRQLVSRILEDAGFDVAVASDGREAIERLVAEPHDLIVLDIMMPGIDGWEVLGHVARMEAPPSVLVLTGRAYHEVVERAKHEGAAAVLSKPFRFDELLASCHGLISQRRDRRVLDRTAGGARPGPC
jgi:CheY-like chemotaxis protein